MSYETERAAWIQRHGSRRLRLAVERGYKHDGIYRDERLEKELPGFHTLPHNPKVGEVINPSEAGLHLESWTLAKIERFERLNVRLVWVNPGFEHEAGEYVQISNYLGRHTVYQYADPDESAPR